MPNPRTDAETDDGAAPLSGAGGPGVAPMPGPRPRTREAALALVRQAARRAAETEAALLRADSDISVDEVEAILRRFGSVTLVE